MESSVRFRLVAGGIVMALAGYFFLPRQIDLRGFDPESMARREAEMWRSYYDGKWLVLGWQLYRLQREEFGFSPLDSLRLAIDAGRAARTFRHSRGRAEATAAITPLTAYYGLISSRSNYSFDSRAAAKLELEWWQARREKAGTSAISALQAHLVRTVHQSADPGLEEAARLRTEAMEYRDARRNGRMTSSDWEKVLHILQRSYRVLSDAVNPDLRS